MPDTPLIDRQALAQVFKDPRTLLAFEKLMKQALNLTPADIATLEAEIAAGFLMPSLVGAFGGVGDGSTNNDAAFTAAEADDAAQIYIPAGVFVTTLAQSALTKLYWGPGKISGPAAYMPGRFTYLATQPTPSSGTGVLKFWDGDTGSVEPEWHIIGPDTHEYVGSRYFEAAYMMHPAWLDVYSGSSGIVSTGAVGSAIGDTSLLLTSADGMTVGKTYDVTPYGADGTVTDTVVIDTVVGATITFHPPLTTTYPNLFPDGTVPGRASFRRGNRTWAGVRYSKVTAKPGGAGDVYGDIVRTTQSYVPLAGQTHFFETCTVGQYGGDVTFTAGTSGTYATGWESQYADGGNDVAVIAQVETFNRTNDTGARSVGWFGTLFNSSGTKPVDGGHVLGGKFRVGLDTVRADLTTWITAGDNLNAAINTAIGHRWIMNSTWSVAGRTGSGVGGRWPALFGNTPGDMYIESGNDGVSDFIAMRFNRAAGSDGRIRLRPNALQVNVDITGAGGLALSGGATIGGALAVTGGMSALSVTTTGSATIGLGGSFGGTVTATGSFAAGGSLGVWGHAPPGAAPNITGVLSAVADANAKAVLTSIIGALTPYGLATNGTT